MMNKLILVWCLSYLYIKADAGKTSRYPDELPGDSQCSFDASRMYNVTDFLRCVSALMGDLATREDARSLRRASESNSLAYRENPYVSSLVDLLSGLFNNGFPSINEGFPLGAVAADGQYQLNRPVVPGDPSGQFDGLGVNLYDALSSISRYDDFKCVPRMLCEVASGRPPGEYKRASSSYLSDLGRNALAQLLVGFDEAGTSPVLNFARAAALGYSSRGDPAACYRVFPRCPRNPDKLVHYLNNHNGGFFRFFAGYHQQQPHASQGNSKFLRGRKRKALPPGYAGAVADRTGTGKLKFDIPVLSAQRDYGKSSFRKENISGSSRRVVFPLHEEPYDRPAGIRIPESSSGYESTDVEASTSRNSPPFVFPQQDSEDSEDQDVRVSRFAAHLSDSESRGEFRFPS
ncbi:hypothetical protein EAI_07373 [Harpegnathos saltator]|uniref:Uncharacterized protein n=1 Tax=Harpegnathos saltator TaxID=610380 RepID=E2BIG0_HARSA|nr:hypothetical protein EAI_07373 [Harpegnathos saltator]